MDERIMNLFSFIADQVQNKQDLFSNEEKIMDALITSGYRLHEADAALTIMQALVQEQAEDILAADVAEDVSGGMRIMNTEERARFTIDAFSFIVKLAHLGIISEDLREDLIEKALSLHVGKVELAHAKALIAVNLFANAQEHEEFLSSALDRKGTAWN